TASKTFTALEATGQEALVFDFNASALTGKKLVVFEELTQAGQLVATHSDLNDANQTVEVPTKPAEPTALKTPEIKTNATNAKENTKMIPAIEKAQVKDVVDYKHLLPGKEYDGKEVTASKTNQLLPATGEVKSILLVIVGFLLLVLSVLVLRYLSKNR
ncbi:LPXTG-domain-containing protein cell wall anchor domain, partial [Enterococcus villorum ATCC 700913]